MCGAEGVEQTGLYRHFAHHAVVVLFDDTKADVSGDIHALHPMLNVNPVAQPNRLIFFASFISCERFLFTYNAASLVLPGA